MSTADVTLITPTADQPIGIGLLERYVAAQTAWGRLAAWVVVDDGDEPAELTLGQRHIRREREHDCTPERSLCRNLLAALPHATTPYVVVLEHDDSYLPRHIEMLLQQLEKRPEMLAAGDDIQRYYHVGLRRWHVFENWGGSLYATGFRREALPIFERAARSCEKHSAKGIDALFWQEIGKLGITYRARQCVGIKGLPGRPGIGIGHRLEGGVEWKADPGGHVLRDWCGDYAKHYRHFYQHSPSEAVA